MAASSPGNDPSATQCAGAAARSSAGTQETSLLHIPIADAIAISVEVVEKRELIKVVILSELPNICEKLPNPMISQNLKLAAASTARLRHWRFST